MESVFGGIFTMENHERSTFWKIDNDDLLEIYGKAVSVADISPQFIALLIDELERRNVIYAK